MNRILSTNRDRSANPDRIAINANNQDPDETPPHPGLSCLTLSQHFNQTLS